MATVLMTSKADDYIRGIDLVIESEQDSDDTTGVEKVIKHLGLGIDVALASEKGISHAVETKKEKVRKMLRGGKLSEARYVSGGSFEGKLDNLPYLIVSISRAHVENLFSSVLKKGSSEKEKNHILKYIVAYQIVKQLGTYYTVLDKRGRDDLAYIYGTANNFAYDIFGTLVDEMRTKPEIWEKVSQDAGVREIDSFCADLEKEAN